MERGPERKLENKGQIRAKKGEKHKQTSKNHQGDYYGKYNNEMKREPTLLKVL